MEKRRVKYHGHNFDVSIDERNNSLFFCLTDDRSLIREVGVTPGGDGFRANINKEVGVSDASLVAVIEEVVEHLHSTHHRRINSEIEKRMGDIYEYYDALPVIDSGAELGVMR